MTAMVAGAREQLAGVRDKAVADVTVRELEMQARSALMSDQDMSLHRTLTVVRFHSVLQSGRGQLRT